MFGILYIATKDIKNEEVFVDYRLKQLDEFPEWYESIDAAE